MSIKARLLKLNKRQVDLMYELRKRGFPTIQHPEVCDVINRRRTTPKAQLVLEVCNEILTDWEKSAEK